MHLQLVYNQRPHLNIAPGVTPDTSPVYSAGSDGSSLAYSYGLNLGETNEIQLSKTPVKCLV